VFSGVGGSFTSALSLPRSFDAARSATASGNSKELK
jgi:hypothetical protein